MNEDHARVRRSEVTGTDFDQARALLQGEYNGAGFTVEPTAPSFSYRYSSVGDDELTLRGSLFAGSVHGSILTEGEYIVSWLTAGSGATDLGRDAVLLAHGQPAVLVNNRPAEFDFTDYRQNLMHFDGAFLERVAAEHEGATGPLLFDTRARPTGEALQKWGATVATVARIVYSTDSPELLRREANRTAAIALLDTFPHVALAVPAELALPSTARLRTAIEYLHAHSHEPVHVEDVAAAAGLSLRGLQALFRRELELSPLDYLRRIRLDRVREELRAGQAGALSVAEVAHRWGFAHLGRFSASYARRFGEYPRATLHG
ncbi:helix-turn-helix transcriptional regulator [Rathayibacter festucae]|uniref:helix-turn-helix transcriptional regulator n=1 Tax=Rathayibacter festucae TaxID=110937 RepID=UPI002A69C34C|nr:helix-turn-helix transcriptional regulator [Rathayibacter festucae]MDY0913678.1 helix-turn-helix transcriptional regulator [Rathayibacter festucae]